VLGVLYSITHPKKRGPDKRNQKGPTSSMALVVMCGQPCSGKSAAAACLAAALRTSSTDLIVRIIDESSLHLGRNDSYKDMVVEKNLRGVLRSEVDRSVSRDSIIIVDSLNNIKVGQYQILHPIFTNF
jgi:protein KTI12